LLRFPAPCRSDNEQLRCVGQRADQPLAQTDEATRRARRSRCRRRCGGRRNNPLVVGANHRSQARGAEHRPTCDHQSDRHVLAREWNSSRVGDDDSDAVFWDSQAEIVCHRRHEESSNGSHIRVARTDSWTKQVMDRQLSGAPIRLGMWGGHEHCCSRHSAGEVATRRRQSPQICRPPGSVRGRA